MSTKPSRAAISFWAVDSLLYMLRCRSERTTEELLARAASFIDAYVMFDQVVLPARYQTEPELLALAGVDLPFEFFGPDAIMHSSDLRSGISIDLNVDVAAFEDLRREDNAWYEQHTGYIVDEDFWAQMAEEARKRSSPAIGPAHLRLWQWGLMNELCDRFGAVALPLPSLRGVEKVLPERARTESFVYEKYFELQKHWLNIQHSVSRYVSLPTNYTLEACPPLFAILLDWSKTREDIVEVLLRMRQDFRGFREIQRNFLSVLEATHGLRERNDLVREWNSSWEKLHRSDFRKPSFLRRTVTTSEVAKSVAEKSISPSVLIEHVLDHWAEAKAYKRFRLFSELAAQLDAIEGTRGKMEQIFGVREIVAAPGRRQSALRDQSLAGAPTR